MLDKDDSSAIDELLPWSNSVQTELSSHKQLPIH